MQRALVNRSAVDEALDALRPLLQAEIFMVYFIIFTL